MSNKPIAVLISDIHFKINTLPLASHSLRSAVAEAESLDVPLIIAGDLNDTKAVIRAEVANEIITIIKDCKVKIYILEGNHDKINEKGIGHGLNYLQPYASIIDSPTYLKDLDLHLIPYHSDIDKLKSSIDLIKRGSLLIMHQGFKGAWMGDYVQDKSSLDPEFVKDYKVISGHYHKHQTVGTVTYIGSPYTITYGEANDGPKGYLVLNSDGSFTRQILELRKHIIVDRTIETAYEPVPEYNSGDLLWFKIKGPYSELKKLNKKLFKYTNFKLDLNPIDTPNFETAIKGRSDEELFDALIDELSESVEHKQFLKGLWRHIYENNEM